MIDSILFSFVVYFPGTEYQCLIPFTYWADGSVQDKHYYQSDVNNSVDNAYHFLSKTFKYSKTKHQIVFYPDTSMNLFNHCQTQLVLLT